MALDHKLNGVLVTASAPDAETVTLFVADGWTWPALHLDRRQIAEALILLAEARDYLASEPGQKAADFDGYDIFDPRDYEETKPCPLCEESEAKE